MTRTDDSSDGLDDAGAADAGAADLDDIVTGSFVLRGFGFGVSLNLSLHSDAAAMPNVNVMDAARPQADTSRAGLPSESRTGLPEGLLADLQAAVSPDRVRTDTLERDLYSRDASLYGGQRPPFVCFPETTQELADVVRACHEHDWPFVARGSGTGLAGGAAPLGSLAADSAPAPAVNLTPTPVVISTSKMNQILSVDAPARMAWVQPGVLNLDLTRQVSHHNLHYAPDPSSQQVCTIGGNVATNSGGPHCLAYGVTSAHVIAVKVVLPDGSLATLGDESPEPAGYDLRGAFVGSEGTLGIAAEIAVRLTPNPPATKTMLASFESVTRGAATVSGIIASGLVPAALEMMDKAAVSVVAPFTQSVMPADAAAVLLVELDGLPAGLSRQERAIREIAADNGVRDIKVAADDLERELFWRARKSAFGAVSRLAPDYYLHDTVVPRTRLVEVLTAVYDITESHGLQVCNVFHAGDGNLHPILSFDAREPGVLEKVALAADEIVQASLDAGGVLTGEHGIGMEKRDYMGLMFSVADLAAQDRLRSCFDPRGLANPFKVIPAGSGCGDMALLGAGAAAGDGASVGAAAGDAGGASPSGAAAINQPVPNGAWV